MPASLQAVAQIGSPDTVETVDLSVVIPVYNEADNLDRLHSEIGDALSGLALRYEIVYVNDGSRDGSAARLTEFAHAHPETVVYVNLRRNFGQTAAIAAGIDHARGEIVALLDADLQNDPADIPMLIRKLNEGYDVVSGWRRNRKDKWITRRLPSIAANFLISTVTGVHLHDYGCTLKVYRRDVLDEVRLYGEMHRFIPVFAAAAGAAITEVEVHHRPRLHGKSNYGLWRTFKVLLDLITVKFLLSYRTTPMFVRWGGSDDDRSQHPGIRGRADEQVAARRVAGADAIASAFSHLLHPGHPIDPARADHRTACAYLPRIAG